MVSESKGVDAVKRFADIVLTVSCAFIIFIIVSDYQAGGNDWRQADWLVHNFSGQVRRGIFGTLLLQTSDLLRINPLLLLCTLQAGLVAGLYFTFHKLANLIEDRSVSIFILLSPALFTMFWMAVPGGAVRKELLAYLGLTLSALGMLQCKPLALWLGGLLLSIAFIAHEGLLVFVPAFAGLLWFCGLDRLPRHQVIGVSVLILTSATFTFFYTIIYRAPIDDGLMCQFLIDRQIDGRICNGAIMWMGQDLDYTIKELAAELRPFKILGFSVGLIISLLPFLYLKEISNIKRADLVAFLACVAPVFLLYPIALDWGRWVSMQIFTLSVLIICGLVTGRITLTKSIPNKLLWGFCLMALVLSPTHILGLRAGGAIRTLLTTFV